MNTPLTDLVWDLDVARNILANVCDDLEEREASALLAVAQDVELQLDWLVDTLLAESPDQITT